MDVTPYIQLITALNATDDATRKPAEAQFDQMKKEGREQGIAAFCVICATQSLPEITRQLASVFLRQLCITFSKDAWETLTPNTQANVKQQLLVFLASEPSKLVLANHINFTSILAALLDREHGKQLEKQQQQPTAGTPPLPLWPELLPFVFSLTQKSYANNDAVATNLAGAFVSFELFGNLAYSIEVRNFGNYIRVIRDLLARGLATTAPTATTTSSESVVDADAIRTSALMATSAFVSALAGDEGENENTAELALFKELLPAMLMVLSQCLNSGAEESAQQALTTFIEIASEAPFFFKNSLGDLLGAMFTIISATKLDTETRSLAMEVIMELVRVRPVMMKKQPNFVNNLINVLMQCMTEKDEGVDEDWLKFEDAADTLMYDIGENSLDRAALALKGRAVVPVLFAMLPQLFSSSDWRHRYAGIMSIGIIGEGCKKVLKTNLGDCINNISLFVNDPEPRVRWAMCNSLAQLCTDFAPSIQKHFGQQILSVLLRMMSDPVARVHSHACSCLINFSESCDPDTLLPFLDSMIGALAQLLSSTGATKVQEMILSALSALAEAAGTHFEKHYDTFVPFLKKIISANVSEDCKMLKAKAMECITLIGSAVDPAKFRADAGEVLQALLTAQNTTEANSDTSTYYLEASFSRLAECLGKDFLPFLDKVLPPTLARAALTPEIIVINEETSEENMEGWEVVPFGANNIGIHTSQIDDKLSAVIVLTVYATALGADFSPHADIVLPLATANLTFGFNESVRATSAALCSAMIKNMFDNKNNVVNNANANNNIVIPGIEKVNFENNVVVAAKYVLQAMLAAMKEEEDLQVMEALISNIALVVENVVENKNDQNDYSVASAVLSNNIGADIITALKDVVEGWVERFQKRMKGKLAVADDDDEIEKVDDEDEIDEMVAMAAGDTIGVLAKCSQEATEAVGTIFMPLVAKMLTDANAHPAIIQKACCVVDDLVQHRKTGQLVDAFSSRYIELLSTSYIPLRQAVAFGLGVFAEAAPTNFAPFVARALPALYAVCSGADARNESLEDVCAATENAISAVHRIIKAYGAGSGVTAPGANLAEATAFFCNAMPLVSDAEEGLYCHTLFVKLAMANAPEVAALGPQRLIATLASIVTTIFSNAALDADIKGLFAALQASLGQEQINAIFSALPQESQEHVKKCIASQ